MKQRITQRCLIACLLTVIVGSFITAAQGEQQAPLSRSVSVSFEYNRGNTIASNQVAIWVTDESGALVKTIYVSRFTADGGFAFREDTLPDWVAVAKPADMTEEAIDAVSGATLEGGQYTFLWDGTNDKGKAVLDGAYTIHVEGTLYWSSIVHAIADVQWDGKPAASEVKTSYTTKDETNRDMLNNIQVIYTGDEQP